MAIEIQANRQYQQPKIPANWSAEERRFASALFDVLDEIFLRYGRLTEKDLSKRLRETISTTERQAKINATEISQTASSVGIVSQELAQIGETVTSNTAKIEENAREIALRVTCDDFNADKIHRGDTPPENPQIDMLWMDTANMLVLRWDGGAWKPIETEALHNTALTIDENGIRMGTTGVIEAYVDDVLRLSIDETGVSAQIINAEELRARNVVEKHLTSTVAWKGSIQASIDACPKILTQDATLIVPAGTYQEDVRISGFSGAALTVKFSPGVYLNGTVSILCCTSVTLTADAAGDACIYPGYAAESTVTIRDCARVVLKNLQISGYRERTGADNGSAAACASTGSFLYAEGCSFEYGKKGLSISQGQGYVNDCIGGTSGTSAATNANLEYGVYASCEGRVSLSGKFPRGGKAGYGVYRSVIDTYDLGNATSGGMTMPGDEYITRIFTPSKHCTYAYGVTRYRDDQTSLISQGRYGSYSSASLGWRIGCLWYAEAVSVLAGKTIRSATLTLRRASGGWSNELPVYLGTVSLLESDFATTLKPEFTQSSSQPDFPAGSLGKESEGVFDVTGLMSALVSGGAIAVNEPRSSYSGTWSPAYTNFYGKGSAYEPVLTVEYK